MKKRLAGMTLVVAAAVALAACTSGTTPTTATPTPTETPDGPTIVAIYEDVNWYPPCATWPIEIGGEWFYPLPWGAPPVDESQYPLPIAIAADDSPQEGLAVMAGLDLPRIMPPGPGDDIGMVIVYSDGMARFESESGNVDWLTREVQEYGYVC